jgi:hypothetical protein
MDNLEKSFKNALTDFDQVSPSKGLWSRIWLTLLLPASPIKTALWSLLILLLISFSAAFISYNLKDDTQANMLQTKSNDEEKNIIANNDFDKKTNSQQIITKQNIPNHESSIDNKTHKQKASKNQTSINREVKPVTNKNASQKSLDKSTYKVSSNDNKSVVVESKNSTAVDNQSKKEKQNTNHSAKQTKVVYSTSAIAATQMANKETTAGKTIETRAVASSNAIEKTTQNASLSETKNMQSDANSVDISRVMLLGFNSAYQPKTENIEGIIPFTLKSKKRVYANRLEIFAGPNIAFNNLTTNEDSYNQYILLRNESESPKLSYHIGANYKTYYNNWFVSFGINYHRIEDRATYSLPTLDIDSVVSSYMVFNNTYNKVITGYIQNPNDTSSLIPVYDIIVSQDTSFVNDIYYDTNKVVKNYSYTNTYSYIEIPLMLGREFRYKQMVFDLAGGVSWGRLIKSELMIPNLDQNRMLEAQQIETIIVKNTFNAILGVGIGYQINENNVLFARPELRYNMNSIFDKTYPIDQKYLQLRLSLGMRIKL